MAIDDLLTVTITGLVVYDGRKRWFVDVRCRGFLEVWGESNWDSKDAARRRKFEILNKPDEFVRHFTRE